MKVSYLLLFFSGLILMACGGKTDSNSEPAPESMVEDLAVQETPAAASDDPMDNKGIGPITEVTLGPIDDAMVAEGKAVYEQLCTACHKADQKFIGPAPKGIMTRRSPEWIMNMILNPEEMVKSDPIAKDLLVEYNMAPMANQGLTEEQARQILEYFRTLE
ncbi:MAG: c-type cytochrome [Cyclobacteriaceae bacterium]